MFHILVPGIPAQPSLQATQLGDLASPLVVAGAASPRHKDPAAGVPYRLFGVSC